MWTKETRCRYERRGLRYPSDVTDAEWALLAPQIPPAKRGGRKREVEVREVMNGLLYVLETGCPWRHLLKDFPPKSTVHGYFDLWCWDGTLERVHDALYVALREHEGREPQPSAAIIDSQSAKSAAKGGRRLIRLGMTQARVRLEGAYHQWRKVPPKELSIDLEADERLGRATGRVEAS